MAAVLGLAIDPAHSPGVVANMARTAEIARLVTDSRCPTTPNWLPHFIPGGKRHDRPSSKALEVAAAVRAAPSAPCKWPGLPDPDRGGGPRLGAFTAVTADRALAEAERIDAVVAGGSDPVRWPACPSR